MGKLTLGCSPLTNDIYAGRLNKSGTQWVGEKHEVTDSAIKAVMQHVYQKAVDNEHEIEELVISNFNGYELKVSAKKVKEVKNDNTNG